MSDFFSRNSFNHSSDGRGDIGKQDHYPLINSIGVSGKPKAVPGGSCLVIKPPEGPLTEIERNPAAANLDSAASTESPSTSGIGRGSGPVETSISTSEPPRTEVCGGGSKAVSYTHLTLPTIYSV